MNILFKKILIFFLFAAFFSCKIFYPVYEEQMDDVFLYRMVEIGGVKQAVMIRGYNPDNPVMLYLHGGPGFPFFPYLKNKQVMRQLEKNFTMVYWEQRGTGKSFSPSIPDKSMNIDRFVNDTKRIIEYINIVTGKDKVFLWAHSWGTNFGALFASHYPELIHAYISTGQSVNPRENEMLAYNFVFEKATKNNNRKALRELQTIPANPNKYSLKDALLVRKWVYRYGGIIKQIDEVRPYVDVMDAFTIFTAKEYGALDKLRLILNPYYSINYLWDDLMNFDLNKEAPEIEVPVYFLLGKHDIIVSSKLAEEYFEKLAAPSGKTLIWFENTAHRPFFEESDKFLYVMNEMIPSEIFALK